MRIAVFAFMLALSCSSHAGAPACDTGEYRKLALNGDWAAALKVADSCVEDSNNQLQKRDSMQGPWRGLLVGNAAEWRRIRAQLYALQGDYPRADAERSAAYSLFEAYVPHDPDGMLTEMDDHSDAVTRAFTLELQGRIQDAVNVYAGLSSRSAETPRLGVLLTRLGDWGGADAWARERDTRSRHTDPTALYVLALIAEHDGDSIGAAGDYLAAQKALQQTLKDYARGPADDYADVAAIRAGLDRATQAAAAKR